MIRADSYSNLLAFGIGGCVLKITLSNFQIRFTNFLKDRPSIVVLRHSSIALKNPLLGPASKINYLKFGILARRTYPRRDDQFPRTTWFSNFWKT